jgi:hypothetical protein
VTVKPITKAVLYALAVQRHGPIAWTWGFWRTARGEFIVFPGRPQ